MDVKMPPVSFDWTVNLTHIASTVMFIVAAVSGYYDLKQSIETNRVSNTAQFKRYDELQLEQKVTDAQQDARVAVAQKDLKDQLTENTREIKQDIRDLRNDLFRGNEKVLSINRR